ncbi:MAG: PEP-CTERM sorting domain-containing protein [Verrucomicrobia bacterium]|nr:PEP-CTERM sorting domain-containing protein [Verrucomicrobiota bacterium]MCH8514302.1 PEP-CTERM sorting domain-containing protein [Kiritimatiellia bacterium]
MKNTLASTIIATLVVPTLAFAQLFWNPTSTDPYQPVGGDGAFLGTNWWDGDENVAFGNGDNLVFEGLGNITGANDNERPGNLNFRNLTGDYSLTTGNDLFSTTGNVTMEDTSGSHNVFIQSVRSGSPEITNNSDGLLSLGRIRRATGSAPNGSLNGTGDIEIGGTFGTHNNIQFNSTGRMILSGSFDAHIVLNNGELYRTDDSNSRSLTWNGGVIITDLDEGLGEANAINLGGAFSKGTGSEFIFDFQNFNATTQGVYPLVTFDSTSFSSTDFAASNIIYEEGLSGQFNLTGDSLEFAVIPEPGTLLLLGIAGIAGLIGFRRRR